MASVAGVSKYHFHRQFQQQFGVSLDVFQRLIRLRRAAWQLAFRPDSTVLDIAIEAGYGSSEAFSRAFKMYGGQSPGAFRAQPDWTVWDELSQPLKAIEGTVSQHEEITQEEVVLFPETDIALKIHTGAYQMLPQSLQQFIQWRKRHHLPPGKSRTFNLFFEESGKDGAMKFGIACSGAKYVEQNEQGVIKSVIPAMRCISKLFTGHEQQLGAQINALVDECKEPMDDGHPVIVERLRWFPDVPHHEAQFKIFLPLKT
nr:helix-turn-helix domain-containing protein [Alteromonas ponticola]